MNQSLSAWSLVSRALDLSTAQVHIIWTNLVTAQVRKSEDTDGQK